jgi:2-polyprenyl-6-methoxyphenol hydroxylase-like FAD-dependent oxidoreductase
LRTGIPRELQLSKWRGARKRGIMRIVCIGGGPAGLYLGLLMKRRHPEHIITVVERNKPYDTFGWGVVFSDAMMQAMRIADPESATEIEDAFNHWDDIELVFKGTRQRKSVGRSNMYPPRGNTRPIWRAPRL